MNLRKIKLILIKKCKKSNVNQNITKIKEMKNLNKKITIRYYYI